MFEDLSSEKSSKPPPPLPGEDTGGGLPPSGRRGGAGNWQHPLPIPPPLRREREGCKVALLIEKVANLTTAFATSRGEITAVEDVSFALDQGEILGIVGQSGSGKWVTALTVLGLLPNPPARIAGGKIRFEGQDPRPAIPNAHAADVRGPGIAMIFQEPMTSLNPVFTDRRPDHRGIRLHGRRRRRARARASSCWNGSAFPTARGGSTTIRTSSPAACANG